ncbi:ketoacyl-ACP synthase III family protein [Kitasatospora sp. NBC_01266]|uniref:ketoacyl-ACP synthase III family protein n=1 Tax=Kitasatospora sp. NBC_01266 TaxID=2903572 RepID=UPI002E380060|nr:ketoacyl-ACP synthase III family protein [Kitasatospora sp. NBC_01266]
MRYQSIYLAGHGSSLPAATPVATAVEQGLLDARTARQTGALAVTVSDGTSGPEFAATAARAALATAPQVKVDLLLHASVYYQGHDLWAPASYLQREVLPEPCPALEVRQLSNGGMAALQLAAGYLAGAAELDGALLTAGDRFCPPGFDRWRGDPGTLYADGGAALLLSRRGGFARLRSVVTVSDPELEGMHRGDDPFGAAPFERRPVIDLEQAKQAYFARASTSFCVARVSAGQRAAVKAALAEAETELAGIDWFVLPHLGRRRLEATYFQPFGIDPARSTWQWSRSVGHLGAADQFAGLDQLRRGGVLRPGQRCLLAGIGAGFSWTCAVVEVLG